MLKHIAAFFAVEKDIRGRSAEEHRLIRQQRGRPLADAFQKWLPTKRGLISQKRAAALRALSLAGTNATGAIAALKKAIDSDDLELIVARVQQCSIAEIQNYVLQQAESQLDHTLKCALRRLRRRRRALRRHRFGDRSLQAERRRSARLSCYVGGHDVELWEGTRQVALLTRSNLPF